MERRHDVLCCTTSPLEEPLAVSGPVRLVLHASSAATDTESAGKLVDVWPDGDVELLTGGTVRARYGDSLSEPSLVEPDRA